jgi:hypothetical protein
MALKNSSAASVARGSATSVEMPYSLVIITLDHIGHIPSRLISGKGNPDALERLRDAIQGVERTGPAGLTDLS